LSLRTQQARAIFAITFTYIFLRCVTHIDKEPSIFPTKFNIATLIA
jgi:hypothetical protein